MKTTPFNVNVTADSIELILAGETVATLNPLSSLYVTNDTDDGFIEDVDSSAASFEETVIDSCPAYVWTVSSSLWEKKTFTLIRRVDRFEYFVTVCGKGRVDSVNYFLSQNETGKKGSRNEFCEGFYPDVDLGNGFGLYKPNRSMAVYSCLSVPPMFYHSYRAAGINDCIAFALVAQAGEHNFTQMDYNAEGHGFSFATDQRGHVCVDGEWTAPKIVIYTAKDHYEAGEKYSDIYFSEGICGMGDPSVKRRFWYGPIACGWIEQVAFGQSPRGDGTVQLSCKQFVYEEMMEKLEDRDLHPTIVIIDDKWQDQYGSAEVNKDRWPDLRGFIDKNLEKGIYTFLWYRLWCDEGLPEECKILDEDSNIYFRKSNLTADPSHPVYQEKLKEIMHRLLSSDEGCYNAAGLKLDFGFCQPHGRKTKPYGDKYGAELLLDYIRQIHTYAKEAKPEAVINASPCHPIFADYVDHARLHDYDSSCRDGKEIFEHRARLWSIALPNALIDTDSAGFNTHRDMMRCMMNQPELGIPDIYCVSDLPNFAFSKEEWATIADLWRDYGKKWDNICKD